ncbi:hypothetical protein [Devosia ginsengisoli]|uniref:Uncharacterized protein n=1 Tax=Devosia ginsengisoli TaxID=400770 RepID=A0A5B8LYG2_9HYPH|nr:hypothetical protein [Devosia ginsengisoli]QDZ12839.1 hypothetical protein FPZ08_20075 [Devosia ginsengisoli]
MFSLFGILKPFIGQPVPSAEAPFKRSFFGLPVDPAAVPVAAEEDALYLADKWPDPPERPPHKS